MVLNVTKTAARKHWQKIGLKHHHGIALFLPGLRTQNSLGIGGYLDLLALVDWCAEVGYDVIQLLPLNDCGDDSSPYNALSAFALNPLLLSLEPYLPNYNHRNISNLRALNRYKRIPYKQLATLKNLVLEDYAENIFRKVNLDRDFKIFLEENAYWLEPYSLVKANGKKKDARTHSIIQYLCHKQLSEVKGYAEDKGIFLKGDIPILVAPESVDVQFNPDLFDKRFSAGAPPDQYSENGQNWGFPIYRWDTHYKEIIAWWNLRLNHASKYYHLYRLDHVVGLFRIWAIEKGHSGKDGHFIPSQKKIWLPRGKKVLKSFLGGCPMLPIAEDLGSVPDAVRECLEELGIPGTKVPRWEIGVSTKKYSPISLTTLSTHDVETMAEWWVKYPDEVSRYAEERGWRYQKALGKERELAILKESHHSSSLFHINLLQEYLHVVPELSWKIPSDDRINVPATHSSHNWSYKYRPTIEEMTRNKTLRKAIEKILRR